MLQDYLQGSSFLGICQGRPGSGVCREESALSGSPEWSGQWNPHWGRLQSPPSGPLPPYGVLSLRIPAPRAFPRSHHGNGRRIPDSDSLQSKSRREAHRPAAHSRAPMERWDRTPESEECWKILESLDAAIEQFQISPR